LTVADLLSIWSVSDRSNLAADLRTRIQECIRHYVLDDEQPTALNISNAVEDFVVHRFNLEEMEALTGLEPEIHVVATLRNFLRANLRELVTELYRNDLADSDFFEWLQRRVPDLMREFFYLCSICFTDGLDGVERFVRSHMV
jgi:hypothetical protein